MLLTDKNISNRLLDIATLSASGETGRKTIRCLPSKQSQA